MTTTTPPAEVLASIRAVVDYDYDTERTDYEREGQPEGHVFLHLERLAMWLDNQPAPPPVHVVEVFDRDDGYYVFADHDDAIAFEATVNGDHDVSMGSACYRTEEAVANHADTLKLIAAECEATPEAEASSLESGVPVATRAWRNDEDAPYSEKLEAVEYAVYREDDGARGKITLWVGLHPDIGCVNIDAGRERLEEEGYEVTEWAAA